MFQFDRRGRPGGVSTVKIQSGLLSAEDHYIHVAGAGGWLGLGLHK
jgi:hypothetical protein